LSSPQRGRSGKKGSWDVDEAIDHITIGNQTVNCQWLSGSVVNLQQVATASLLPMTTLVPLGTVTIPITTYIPTQTTLWQWNLEADGVSTPMSFGFALPVAEGQQVSMAFAFRQGDASFWLVMVNHDTGQSCYLATPDEVLARLRIARFAPFWLTGSLGAFGLSWFALAIFWTVLDWAALGAVRWGALPYKIFVVGAVLGGVGYLGCLAFNRWQRRRSQQTWTRLDVWVQAMVRRYDGTAATQ
jgi:hypothetical protein